MQLQAHWISGGLSHDATVWEPYIRTTTDPPALSAYAEQLVTTDISPDLASVQCRCLVVHPSLHGMLRLSDTRAIAQAVPGARLAEIEGRVYPHLGPDIEANARLIEEFIDDWQDGDHPRPGRDARDALSPREAEVLQLLAAGLTNKQIADQLVLSVHTVVRHIDHIYQKTGVHSRAQATAYAFQHGITHPGS